MDISLTEDVSDVADVVDAVITSEGIIFFGWLRRFTMRQFHLDVFISVRELRDIQMSQEASWLDRVQNVKVKCPFVYDDVLY